MSQRIRNERRRTWNYFKTFDSVSFRSLLRLNTKHLDLNLKITIYNFYSLIFNFNCRLTILLFNPILMFLQHDSFWIQEDFQVYLLFVTTTDNQLFWKIFCEFYGRKNKYMKSESRGIVEQMNGKVYIYIRKT